MKKQLSQSENAISGPKLRSSKTTFIRKGSVGKLMIRFAFLLSGLLFLQSENASATHFRYGHLTWQKLSGNTVRFTLEDAFRRSGYGAPNVGDVILETVGGTSLIFGDATSTGTLKYKVIAVDVAEDWIIGRALDPNDITETKTTIDHTYPSPNNGGSPWLAEINTQQRTQDEVNNPLGDYRLITYVETNSGNRSPVSSLPAIVTLKQSALSTFLVPAADPDANTAIRFRLATATEAADDGNFDQPVGLTVNNLTGLVSWNTLGLTIGDLYSCQIIIEDRDATTNALRTQVAVDFLIEIVDCLANDLPPVFITPSPACASVINAMEGQPMSFTVKASDPDAVDIVELNTGGLPTGATMTPGLPINGNPVTSIFNWTPPIGSAGDHVVIFTATDDCGQQALCSFTIHVTSCGIVCNLGVSFSKTATKCYGSCDGSLTANPSKGLAPYTYLWSNGQTSKTINSLCKGAYTVTVTDSRGCTKVATCSVSSPTAVKITATQVNVKCKGDCTGSLSAVASGGSGSGYKYTWSNGQTTAAISGLCKGPYTVTVCDSKGCTATLTKTITEPAKVLAVTIAKTTCSVCLPNCNGTATANPTGGTSPYTYAWSTGATTKKILYLCAGTYTVTVTDKNGCTTVCQTTIVGNCCNISLVPSSSENTNCAPQCNGTLGVSASGGSGSYKYLWSNGQTTSSIGGLCAGSYSVTVTDLNSPSCFKNTTLTVSDDIDAPEEPLLNVVNSCPGLCSGTIEVSEIPGASYSWSNGQTTALIEELCVDTYTVVITYANGCTGTFEAVVEEKLTPAVFPTYIYCHDACSGTASVINPQDYVSFLWSTGATTDNVSNLCAGITTVTVTDVDGCVMEGIVDLDNPEEIVATCSVVTNESAPGAGDGELHGEATGGYDALNYGLLWSNGQQSFNATGLNAGTYTLTVTDTYGCQAMTTCNINNCNFSVEVGVDAHSHYGYLPEQTVKRKAIVSGGAAPYTYSWSLNRDILCDQGGASGDEVFSNGVCSDNLCGQPIAGNPICTGSDSIKVELIEPGQVCLTVTDANGCITTDCFLITVEDVRCGNNNDKVSVCHHTSSAVNPFVQLCISENAVPAHLAHDSLDFVGFCNTRLAFQPTTSNAFSVLMYPNPANDQVHLEFESPEKDTYHLQIFDLAGRIVFNSEGQAFEEKNNVVLDLNSISEGLYNVRLTIGDHTSFKSLAISR